MSQYRHRTFTLPSAADARGNLAVYSNDGDVPFRAERVFWITGVPPRQVRGLHAHRTCSEVLVAVSGSVTVELTDRSGTETYVLRSPREALLVPPMCWCRIYDFSTGAVLLCMADQPYDEAGYINDFEAFGRLIADEAGNE